MTIFIWYHSFMVLAGIRVRISYHGSLQRMIYQQQSIRRRAPKSCIISQSFAKGCVQRPHIAGAWPSVFLVTYSSLRNSTHSINFQNTVGCFVCMSYSCYTASQHPSSVWFRDSPMPNSKSYPDKLQTPVLRQIPCQ
jgi:hypothetical protein